MHPLTSFHRLPLRTFAHACATSALLLAAGAAHAQASAPPVTESPVVAAPGTPVTTPQSTAGKSAVTQAFTTNNAAILKQSIAPKALPGVRGGLVTIAGSDQAVGEGVRLLPLPGQCTPKTNSLDCVTDSAQSGGANVSGRVRTGVIGEVGAGRGATEGAGKAQGQKTCTPAPGKLTCE